MLQFESDISDSAEGVEKTMTEDWSSRATDLLLTPAGRALSVNAQIGLLVRLHAAGLLKEALACPSSKTGG
jgi:hypothetical protein